ncbi:UDP-Glycosyltransferase/glycogen phosphorylase [Trametes polyzona]|nr:UDP-Glycosyltransferase/glycogen phosphorylase [Trametes polyzona]
MRSSIPSSRQAIPPSSPTATPVPMDSSVTKHLMLFPAHVWGHTRPMCTLAARLVKYWPVTITFCVAAKYRERVQVEITRALGLTVDETEQHGRLRLVLLEQGIDPWDPTMLHASFMSIWEDLLLNKPVSCKTLSGQYEVWNLESSPLNGIIIDLYSANLFQQFYEQRRNWKQLPNLKLYSWLPVATGCIPTLYAEDYIPAAKALEARAGISFDEAAHEILWVPKGEVISSPCLPSLYDYECNPQAILFPPKFSGQLFIKIGWVLQHTDGAITFDAADYNPAATSAMREMFANMSRPFCYAGPLVPQSLPKPASDNVTRDGAIDFLGTILAERGRRSAVCISFGSMLWPSDPAKLDVVIEVFIARSIPFVMSHAVGDAAMLEKTRQKIAEYDGAYSADWIPQQAVLEHPAIGWCLTHGGHNSVLECVLAGVPMIVWPIVVDQPPNAIHLTETLDVAYELLNVRHGTGLGKIYRTGQTPVGTVDAVKAELCDVLDRAFGKDGDEKRSRLEGLRTSLQVAWDEEGVARREVQAFLDGV